MYNNKNKEKPKAISRRNFTKNVIGAGMAVGLSSLDTFGALSPFSITTNTETYDYIIIGSGAGGGPLAANLARAGFRVLVLEAGDNDNSDNTYQVPAWHTIASEQDKIGWEFYVKHYSGDRDRQDSKYVEGKGIFYPRGSTIGGSTTNNALITMYPHDSDFEYIAEMTGDDSWDARKMRKYFERLENCQYLASWDAEREQHGTNGWLPTNYFDFGAILDGPILLDVIRGTFKKTGNNFLDLLFNQKVLDMNKLSVAAGEEGAYLAAQSMSRSSRRTGVREYLLATQEMYPDQLFIQTNALASKILFNDKTAVGVEYYEGKNLYAADRLNNGSQGIRREVRASKEVILAGGAFNSPQLLKLSGIGPGEELQRHGIPVLVDLPQVGTNLQDRYEVGVISELNRGAFESCTFGQDNDPCLTRWKLFNAGPYTSNGVISAWVKRSMPELKDPDLFMFALSGSFKGYYPGYSDNLATTRDKLTWAILKGHTENTAGSIELKDTDPRSMPLINFKFFNDGQDTNNRDMKAVVEAVKQVRSIMGSEPASNVTKSEVWPGPEVGTDEEIAKYVEKEAWGHHASCSNKIGAAGDGVLDSKFRVRGVERLRVVDASIFPKIPGFFLAVPIYLISEKATDEILKDAGVDSSRVLQKQSFYPAVGETPQDIEATLFPNPAIDEIHFTFDGTSTAEDISLHIFSMNGERMLSRYGLTLTESSRTIDIDVSSLKVGEYVYHINSGIQKKSGKFIIRK